MPVPTILVIDDDRLVRWSVSMTLGRAGYRVHEATTGMDGLTTVRDCPPDLVLLDISLPDTDGFSVLRAIRQIRPEVPVLMMTAEPNAETREQAIRLGAYAHLEKPCDAEVLQDVISQALQPASQSDQVRR
jgi:DNA-binding NtrC family response regulator